MPGERPLQTREWSDKQASVERDEKGEWKERSLRIKQLEGAMIYLSIGGNGEKESKLRREDGKNFPGSAAASSSPAGRDQAPARLGPDLEDGALGKRAFRGTLQNAGSLAPAGWPGTAPGPRRNRQPARAAVTSDPARRQPIRAQVVSKPKISTSAKVKMEGSGAEREGGAGPGMPGGRRWRGRLGNQRRAHAGPPLKASRPSAITASSPRRLWAPRTPPVARAPRPRGRSPLPLRPWLLGVVGEWNGGEGLGNDGEGTFQTCCTRATAVQVRYVAGRGSARAGNTVVASAVGKGGCRAREKSGVGECVQGLCERGLREALPNGAGRIPKSGWMERRGWDSFDPSSQGWARAPGRPGIECWEWLGKGSLWGGPEMPGFLGLSHLRGFSRACICSPPFNSSISENSSSCSAPAPSFPDGKVKSCHKLDRVS
ncbi:uncharacterized protein LOC116557286 [Sapajus apella]|uniref:Uncharacterized protein LOC116557286 n=1 Tax=Sapajus apella TaxID=9515 RepID=A0A6J3IJF3_SAPAP|nr:uncharacterized protein LOC116557286 [Sapajus apella]